MTATGAPAKGPVFISFATKELEVAERVLQQLERSGISCWIANRDIAPGASYPAAITAAVTGASAIVLLLTEASNASPHVLSEVELAFNARRPIVPVRLTPLALSADLQYFLGTTQWFDAGTAFDDGDAARLQERLTRIIAGEPIVAEHHPESTSRRWVAYIAAAVALLAAVSVVVGVAVFRGRRAAPGATSAPPPAAATTVETAAPASPATAVPSSPAVSAPSSSAAPAEAHKEGSSLRTRVNPIDGQAYVWIPPGRFTMGCSPGDSECEKDELPAHLVRVRSGFWMSRTEITKAQYAKGRRRSGAVPQGNLPVTAVAWADAKGYCAAVGGRLPTEKEWEWAARAGSTAPRYDVLVDIGWYEGNSDERLHPVGQKLPNAFGLFDMLGNAYEWVADRYYNAYDDTDESLVEPLASNASGVARGGAFISQAQALRVSNRLELPPDAEEAFVGFRCVADR